MKTSVNERIRARRKEINIEPEKIADVLGISRATYYRYESSDIDKIPIANLVPLAKILRTTPAYLMGWEDDDNNQRKDPSFNYIHIPKGVAAGALEEIEGYTDFSTVNLPDFMIGKYARNKNLAIMHVNGESMNKIIQNGSTIAVLMNTSIDSIHNGDVVVAQNCHGEYTVKHFYDDADNNRFILRPDSSDPSFTDMIFNYNDADEMKIFGKVVIYSVYL